ncbi:MAG: LuxR family transcriptional regulator [Pseudomonadota bacterium]|nr:LuxR family transcriptional regulator [Pseudomonadota bacterium]
MSVDLKAFVSETSRETDRHALIRSFRKLVKAHGFTASRYQVLAKEFRPVDWRDGHRSVDYPREWLERYRESNYFDLDPLVEIARKTHEPFYWHEVEERLDLTDAQKEYFVDLGRHGFRDGLVVPVYLRPGEVAYFGLGAKEKVLPLSTTDLLEIQIVCQVTHQRYEQLLEPVETLELAPREIEVIAWIMQGKSNSAIAGILGISNHTVDTLVRRCFRKLGATNRLEASLVAVSRGVGVSLPKAS